MLFLTRQKNLANGVGIILLLHVVRIHKTLHVLKIPCQVFLDGCSYTRTFSLLKSLHDYSFWTSLLIKENLSRLSRKQIKLVKENLSRKTCPSVRGFTHILPFFTMSCKNAKNYVKVMHFLLNAGCIIKRYHSIFMIVRFVLNNERFISLWDLNHELQ